jgi:transcriptional regulator with XRE-family HTH domain
MPQSFRFIDPVKLRALRKKRYRTQEQLAVHAGLSVRTIQELESGCRVKNGVTHSASCYDSTVKALADAFGVDPEELLIPSTDDVPPVPVEEDVGDPVVAAPSAAAPSSRAPRAQASEELAITQSAAVEHNGGTEMVIVAVKVETPYPLSPEQRAYILQVLADILGRLRPPYGEFPGSTWMALKLTPEEAERLFWAIKRGDLAQFGITDVDTNAEHIDSMIRLQAHVADFVASTRAALWAYRQGLRDEALPLVHKAAEAVRRLQPLPSRPDTAAGLNNLAALWLAFGEPALAEEPLLAALAVGRHVWGADHPNQARCLHNLAVLYDRQGKHAEAEREYGRALAHLRQPGRAGAVEIAAIQSNLGSLCAARGKLKKAERLLRESINLRRCAVSLRKLAVVLARQGRHADAGLLRRDAAAQAGQASYAAFCVT